MDATSWASMLTDESAESAPPVPAPPIRSQTMPPPPGAATSPAVTMAAAQARPGAMGAFLLNCLRAFGQAFLCSGSTAVMVLAIVFITFAFGLVAYLLSLAIFKAGLPQLAVALHIVLVLATWLLPIGFVWRYLLSNVRVGIDNSSDWPMPSFKPTEAIKTSLYMLCLLVIFVAPVITIPLLPLALLAAAHTEDGRAYDIRWAFRAMIRQPLALLTLWGVMIVWLAVAAVLFVVAVGGVGMLLGWMHAENPPDKITGMIVGLLFTLFVMYFVTTLQLIPTRCAGLLGHHFPDLLQTLPKWSSLGVSLLNVAGGVVLSVVVWIALAAGVVGLAKRATNAIPGYSASRSDGGLFPSKTREQAWKERDEKVRAEITQDLKRLLQHANDYKRANKNYPESIHQLVSWLQQQGVGEGHLYVNKGYTFAQICSLPETARERPYVLIYRETMEIHYGGIPFATEMGITDTGQVLIDEQHKCMVSHRVYKEYDAATKRYRETQKASQSKSPLIPDVNNTPPPEQVRKELQDLYNEAVAYKRSKGRYPPTIAETHVWVRQQDTDSLTRYPPNADIAPTAGLDKWATSPYILFVSKYQNISMIRVGWAITNTGQIVSDNPSFLPARVVREFHAAQKRQQEEEARRPANRDPANTARTTPPRPPTTTTATDPATPGNTINTVPNAAFGMKKDEDRKFPRKAIPIGVGEVEKARLHMANVWADLQEYREDNDGKLPRQLNELTRRYTTYEGLRSPTMGGNYTYNPNVPEDGVEILVADPEERAVFVPRGQPTPPKKLHTALLSNGQIVQGPSLAAIRARYVEGGASEIPVAWSIAGWAEDESGKAPFYAECHVLLFRDSDGGGYAGAHVGPAAKDRNDKAYAAYKDATRAAFGKIAPSGTAVKAVSNKVGDRTYDRFIASYSSGRSLTVYVGVENGRCVAYWFAGLPKQFTAFQAAIGKAAVAKPTPTTQPALTTRKTE